MKNYLIPAGIAAVIAVLAVFVFVPNQKPSNNFGSQSVAVTEGDCYFFQGVHVCPVSVKMAATSSVPCAIKSPSTATSSLDRFYAYISANGLSTEKFELSTSTTAFASSTPALITLTTVTTGKTADILYRPVATSTNLSNAIVLTNQQGGSINLIAPGTWLTLKIATTTPGTYGSYWTGTCNAQFSY